MTDEMVTIPRKLAEALLDVLAGKFDDAEGGLPPETSWIMDDAVASRALAEAVGADPARYTADRQLGCFPHAFKPGEWEDFQQYIPQTDPHDCRLHPCRHRVFETEQQVIRRLGRFPYEACSVRADRECCSKPAGDPIHREAKP